MLTRRGLLAATATGLAAPAIIRPGFAATPKNVLVMAKQIDDIVGAFDPADGYETTNTEVCGNVYRRIVLPDAHDPNKIVGDSAERWEVSKAGRILTFHIRPGMLFESGKPVTAEDAAFSLQRVVKLGKIPNFILTQFGYTKDNVDQLIVAKSDSVMEMNLPDVWATTFVLYCLSANCASVVEKATALAHEVNGDLGNAWLRTHSAGSGPYRLVDWQASEHIIVEANPHGAVKPHIPRIVIRHTAEASAQLLLLQKGDADIARDLTSDQLKSISEMPNYSFAKTSQLNCMYICMNMNVPQFQKVEVFEAVKWAINYDAIAKNITPEDWSVWQSLLPKGSPSSIPDRPYKKDVAKAKALLAKAGYPDGFSVTFDHFAKPPYREIAQAIQADLADVGIKVQLLAAEEKQVLGKMRSRQHQMLMNTWAPDYLDPNSNVQAFNSDPDDGDGAKMRLPAWRNHFVDKGLTDMTVSAAKELDAKKRNELYATIQREDLKRAPWLFLLQQAEIATMGKGVSGITIGVLPDFTRYAQIVKT
jgi:peptide/nickel transport system substrate-binding protein